MTVFDFINNLCCPDDRGDLHPKGSELECERCGRIFEVGFEGICANLLPSKKFERKADSFIEKRSVEIYSRLFDEPFVKKQNPTPWGLEVPSWYVPKLNKHKYVIDKVLDNRIFERAIDISTGSGRFSWDLANRADVFVFSDISVDSALYLSERILEERVKNAIVVRCDYMSPPFKNDTFSFVLCNDTAIYGYEHEMGILRTIQRILFPTKGIAIVDLCNKYHRGFWHKPYTSAYSKKEMEIMLKMIGYYIQMEFPLYYELDKDLDERTLFSRISHIPEINMPKIHLTY